MILSSSWTKQGCAKDIPLQVFSFGCLRPKRHGREGLLFQFLPVLADLAVFHGCALSPIRQIFLNIKYDAEIIFPFLFSG